MWRDNLSSPAMMNTRKSEPIPPSPALRAGLISLAAALLLLMVHWRLSVMLLSGYAMLYALAPFIPRLGFFVPVTSRGRSGRQAVALTFDDGPDPMATPALLELLSAHKVQATFFVSGCKVVRYPHLVEAVIRGGHTIGNHSYHHNPLVFFKGSGAVRDEIEATQRALKQFGIVPRVYRPPVGIMGPGLRTPLHEAGLQVVNFSCRAFDGGNKRLDGMADRILKRVQADDIVLLHDIMPKGQAYGRIWLQEMEALLNGLQRKGLVVLPLQDLIGGPVMEPCVTGVKPSQG